MSKNHTQNTDSSSSLRYLFAAWLIALLASLFVLFIGEILGQTPCDLCWFQRAFMFPLAIILGIAVWNADFDIWPYGLALAGLGLLISTYHTLLYSEVIPSPITPCTASGPSCTGEGMLIFNLPIPSLALIAFAAISTFLLMSRKAIK